MVCQAEDLSIFCLLDIPERKSKGARGKIVVFDVSVRQNYKPSHSGVSE